MGVYFPNMKKPPTCSECPVKLDCGLYFDIPVGGIDSNCPVIYVNSPHGKLGDLDALLEQIRDSFEDAEKWRDAVENDPEIKPRAEGTMVAFWECGAKVKMAPTIIPSEGGNEDG